MPQINREGIQSNDTLIIRIDPEKIPQQKLVALDEVLTEEVMEALDLGKRVVCLLRGEHEEDDVYGVDVTVYTIIGYHASTDHEYIEFVIDIGGPQPVSMDSYPNTVFGGEPESTGNKGVVYDLTNGEYESQSGETIYTVNDVTIDEPVLSGTVSNSVTIKTSSNVDVVFPDEWEVKLVDGEPRE